MAIIYLFTFFLSFLSTITLRFRKCSLIYSHTDFPSLFHSSSSYVCVTGNVSNTGMSKTGSAPDLVGADYEQASKHPANRTN